MLDQHAPLKKVFIALILPAFIFHVQPLLHSDLKIAFVNVGQGDCIVIELPRRKSVIVIDAGAYYDLNRKNGRSAKPYMKLGVKLLFPI